jgi:FAD/FMN-containing dehydrogenase
MVISVARDEAGYEELRTRYFNARLPECYPAEITSPKSTRDVVRIMREASARKQNVGVRSGGHLFPACSLLQDGILINARSLNSSIDYDETTKVLCFGLGCLSHELAAFCVKINRFFSFGHSPPVGVGGFLLCGG